MLHIALYQPEIPPNTGNIMRLCANAGALLHLIHPCGFSLNDKQLRRAGLDYHQWANVKEYKNYDEFMRQQSAHRVFACTTKGKTIYSKVKYQNGDLLLFGPETRGLPIEILSSFPEQQKIKIPMMDYSRSINLANACSIILYEAWRQLDFHRLM